MQGNSNEWKKEMKAEKKSDPSYLLQERHVEGATLKLIHEILTELLQRREGPVGAEGRAAELSIRLAVLDHAEHAVAGGRA